MSAMTVSRLAKEADVNLETVRYYEREGLMPPPSRSASGYRLYDDSDVDRLRFISRSKELGFTLKETKELLWLCSDQDTSCKELCNRARDKVHEIERRIASLQKMAQSLHDMVDDCSCGRKTVRRCSIAAFLNSKETP